MKPRCAAIGHCGNRLTSLLPFGMQICPSRRATSVMQSRAPAQVCGKDVAGLGFVIQLLNVNDSEVVWGGRRDSTCRSMRAGLVGTRWFATVPPLRTKHLRKNRLNAGYSRSLIRAIFVANVARTACPDFSWLNQSRRQIEISNCPSASTDAC